LFTAQRQQALRTVWLSDVHLGSRECRVQLLLDFLRHIHCEVLYLVGDIVDIESLRKRFYWPASHTEVLRLLLKKSQEGTRIVYLPGNHDHDLRTLAGLRFGGIEIATDTVHALKDGRKLLVTHGDQFDAVVRRPSLGVWLGSFACRRLLTLNRFVHWLHDVFNRPYWSLAQHLKDRFPLTQAYVERYRNATLAAARAAGVDGVVCGHIHWAAVGEVGGLVYCNSGDWVESCTALVENRQGELSLLEWRPTAAAIMAAASVSVWAHAVTSNASEQQAA
jgi:UDP-2,3-diacylglucosamine pyrophosphatase LpxH